MRGSRRRLFDSGLILLGLTLAAAIMDISLLHGAASRMLAMTLVTWLMCSLPLAMLIGHCTLSED
jgi:uncharacterized membrane protein